MTTNYDPIAEQYKRSKQQPWRADVEAFTLMRLIGETSHQNRRMASTVRWVAYSVSSLRPDDFWKRERAAAQALPPASDLAGPVRARVAGEIDDADDPLRLVVCDAECAEPAKGLSHDNHSTTVDETLVRK
jgi:hypothetical protein